MNKDEVASLFESEESYSWGIADGSGDPIEGTFSEVTAGLVQLPTSYEGTNYYSFFRPAGPDEFELDWGTWVMGVEFWLGQPYLSYMVHYEWEI